VNRALKVIAGAGGSVTETEVRIPAQEPKAPPLEQWVVDPPTARVGSSDAAWTWDGGWADARRDERATAPTLKAAAAAGATATLRFRGTGVTVAGRCSQEGGRADVFLDGQKVGEIDAYVVPRTHDNDYWHVTGLPPGEHTLRIVTRPDRDERSTGNQIAVETAVIYGR
jgi:hyaluronate lyase